jgi:hypothetical protein
MNKIIYSIVFLLFSWLNCAVADEGLQEGVWPASIKLAGKDKAAARVHVSKQAEADAPEKTRITMYVEDTPLEFIDLDIRKNSLHFNLDTGTLSKCIMNKDPESGAYQGFCEVSEAKDKKERIELSMRPPTQPDSNSEETEQPKPANE